MKPRLTASIVIRSSLFWLIAAAALPFYCGVALFIQPFSPLIRHRVIMSIAHYFTFLLKYVGGIKYQVIGTENIPATPVIFAGNHQSAWETAALNCILPPCVWIMKKEILRIPFFGWGIRALMPIAIDRSRGEQALAQVIEQGKQRFKLGFGVIMFPEGTRVKPKTCKPFKYGSAKLALNLNVPIVPFAHNAGYVLPKNSFYIYPGMVTVIIGAPIYPASDDPVAYTQQIESWVRQQLARLDA